MVGLLWWAAWWGLAPVRLAARLDLRDVVALAGLGMLGYGLWLFWPPAAYMAVGALLFGLAIWRAR